MYYANIEDPDRTVQLFPVHVHQIIKVPGILFGKLAMFVMGTVKSLE